MSRTVEFVKMPPNDVNGPDTWSFDIQNNDPKFSATCSRILDFLFVGGIMAAENETWLRQMNITCVINVRRDPVKNVVDGIEYMDVDVDDDDYEPIHWYFDDTGTKIEAHRKTNGKVLINCEMGISRSATICMMYMVRYQNRSLRQAYFELKQCRPCIYPNLYFWPHMIKHEKEHRKEPSVLLKDIVGHSRRVPDVYLMK